MSLLRTATVAGGIGLLCWWIFASRDQPHPIDGQRAEPHSDQPSPATLAEAAPTDSRVAVSADSPRREERLPEDSATDLVVLESDAGLPLHDVYVLDGEDATSRGWSLASALKSKTVALPSSSTTRYVRAAGHQDTEIPPGPGRTLVRADTMLVLKRSREGGGSFWLSWDVGRSRRQWTKRLCAAGIVDDDFVVAVRAEDFLEDPALSNPLEISLLLGSGWRAHLRWYVVPSHRAVEWLPAEYSEDKPRGELVARVKSDLPAGGGEWQWRLSPQESDGALEADGPERADILEREWGTLILQRRSGFADSPGLNKTGDAVVFEDVFFGAQYIVLLHAEDWSWMGRKAITFQGQEIVMTPIRGRMFRSVVLDAETGAPIFNLPVRIDFYYGDPECNENLCAWNSYVERVVGPDGEMAFSALNRLSGSSELPWPPPTRGTAKLKAAGYREWRGELTWQDDGGGIRDLGVISLRRVEGDMRVWPRQLNLHDEYLYLHWGEREDRGEGDIEGYANRDAGVLNVKFVMPEAPIMREILAGVAERSAGLVLEARSGALAALLPLGDGDWIQQDSRGYRVRVIVERGIAADESVQVGWNWRGVDMALGFARNGLDGDWVFDAPEEGVGMWYEVRSPGDRLVLRESMGRLVQGATMHIR